MDARLRREDAETVPGNGARHSYGFWGFTFGARRLQGGVCSVVVRLKSGAEMNFMLTAEMVEDHEMRKFTLGYLAQARYFGNSYFEGVAAIEHSIGEQMIDFNKMLSRRAVNAPYVERFGESGRRYKGSIIVCLYGKGNIYFCRMPCSPACPAYGITSSSMSATARIFPSNC